MGKYYSLPEVIEVVERVISEICAKNGLAHRDEIAEGVMKDSTGQQLVAEAVSKSTNGWSELRFAKNMVDWFSSYYATEDELTTSARQLYDRKKVNGKWAYYKKGENQTQLSSASDLKKLIAVGDIGVAVENLVNNADQFDKENAQELTSLSSEMKNIQKRYFTDSIKREEYNATINQITLRALRVIDSLPENEAPNKNQTKTRKKGVDKREKTPYELALEEIERFKNSNTGTLDLSRLNLTSIPREIKGLTNLVELNLVENKIKEIENLDGLINLTDLDLGLNEIHEIKNLDHLTKLRYLNLSYNPMTKVQGLHSLKQLEHLYLNDCQIKEIEDLDEFENLLELDISFNEIENFPTLTKSKGLKELSLDHNLIDDIPDFSSLESLQFLYLNDNKISASSISGNQTFFDYLKNKDGAISLKIHNNPFFSEIESLNEADYSENINHYMLLLNDESIITAKESTVKIVLPHKLVLLGNSNAGKSSLVDYLINDELQDGSPKDSTEVLDIVQWKPEGKPEFFIYDFGGQDYYHATYQMFFSEEASYILLWSKDSNLNSLNKEKTSQRPEDYHCFDVNYWLGNIQYLNDTVNSNPTEEQENKSWYKNLILVENKIDADFDQPNPLKTDDRFGEIEQFRISLWGPAQDKIFETRRNWLKDYLQNIHHAKSEETQLRKNAIEDYLQEWTTLKQKKNEWRFQELKDYLKSKFASWAMLDDDDFARILNRFNVSGLIIWYRNVKKLEDRIWVDPNQLQEPILKLLNEKSLKGFNGKIPLKNFNNIPDFEHYRDLLLQKQIITYDAHDEKYIVPQRLQLNPYEDPLYEIAIQGLTHSFTIKFNNFMPLGIMNRLIHMFGEISDKKYYSRYEMIFSLDTNKVDESIGNEKVLLQCDMQELHITFSCTNDSEELWKEIFVRVLMAYHRMEDDADDELQTKSQQKSSTRNLKRSNSAFAHLKSDFEHLVPDDLQISLDDQYFVDYTEIKKAIASKLKKVQVYRSKEDIKGVRIYNYSAFFADEIRKPKKVFISYSHDDLEFRKELQKYLINMERDNLIEVWQDGMIQPGTDWDLTIKHNLEKADIIILLVSQSFIASNYIHEVELRKTLEKQLDGTAQFFPILLKNCDFTKWNALPKKVMDDLGAEKNKSSEGEKISLAQFQFMPHNEEQRLKPINSWQYPEDAWVQINNLLRDYVNQ